MSHYSCKKCGQQYDDCTCAAEDHDAWKCNKERFCDALENRVEAESNQRTKGIVSVLIGNFRTGESYSPGVCYKRNAKDAGLMFNFCPFCGVNLEALLTRTTTPAAKNGGM